jgi:hypothetical protein
LTSGRRANCIILIPAAWSTRPDESWKLRPKQEECRYGDGGFEQIETELENGWNSRPDGPSMPWTHARNAVKDGYEWTMQIRRARDVPEVTDEALED